MFFAAALIAQLAAINLNAAPQGGRHNGADNDKYVHTPNYALAERFSSARTARMVFTTDVRPQWFRNGEKL